VLQLIVEAKQRMRIEIAAAPNSGIGILILSIKMFARGVDKGALQNGNGLLS
jgi:hypothetical protein